MFKPSEEGELLRSGRQYLDSLCDGRTVYIGGEPVADVTRHPAFADVVRTVAAIYDAKIAHPNVTQDATEPCSAYFLRARSRDELTLRSQAHRQMADLSYGMLGRSPDYVASFVTGMAMAPEVFGEYTANISAYYDHIRRADLFLSHAVVPLLGARDPSIYGKAADTHNCRVVAERDDGVVVSGVKMLATAAIISNEIWIGNLIPLAPTALAEAITFAIPCNAPGLSLWSRKSMMAGARTDSPLASRFDETDCVVVFDNVKVDWSRVFVHNNPILARSIYFSTPAHSYGNHQAVVRFHAKLRLLVGLARRLSDASGVTDLPQVRDKLGFLAASEAALAAMIAGQLQAAEDWPAPYVTYNRRMMYGALAWCTNNYSTLIDVVRELCGSGVFQMPADFSVLDNDETGPAFRKYWSGPNIDAVSRMKLYNLAWDLLGSEFAARQMQYERLFAGPQSVVSAHSFREAPWEEFAAISAPFLE